MTRHYAYALGGNRAVDSAPLCKPKNTTILSSIQANRIYHYTTFPSGTTVARFKDYLENDLIPYLSKTSVLVIDKSRILKYLGHLAPEDMQRLDYALKNSLALNPLGSIRKLKPIIRSTAAYAPPEVVDGKPPVYPYTPIQSSFEDAGSVEEMMLYTELQSAVHAMIQRLEYSFTFNPSLLTIPKRKQQVSEILAEAEKYIWRIREEMQCE